MKKLAIVLILALLLTGCGKEPARDFTASEQALLEQLGVDMDAYQNMTPESQEQLLNDLGIGSQQPRYTLEDAEGQGRYLVVLSDTMGYNTFTLYYEDGALIKVVTAFRKAAQDTPTVSSCDGYPLEDYHFKGIRLADHAVSALAQLLSQEGFAQSSVVRVD